MFTALQNPLSLVGRVLLALLFVPSGWSKLNGFAGTVAYITSKGVPLPERQLSTKTTFRRSRMPIETEALAWSASSFMWGRATCRALMLASSG